MSQTILLKVSEVAQVLKLNILTVYQYIRQQKLSAVKIGRNYRIEEKDLSWLYIAAVALVHPQTLSLQLTHFAPWPREDTFGEVSFVISFISFLYGT